MSSNTSTNPKFIRVYDQFLLHQLSEKCSRMTAKKYFNQASWLRAMKTGYLYNNYSPNDHFPTTKIEQSKRKSTTIVHHYII